jgi:hypothetical protein
MVAFDVLFQMSFDNWTIVSELTNDIQKYTALRRQYFPENDNLRTVIESMRTIRCEVSTSKNLMTLGVPVTQIVAMLSICREQLSSPDIVKQYDVASRTFPDVAAAVDELLRVWRDCSHPPPSQAAWLAQYETPRSTVYTQL